jgi:hypothetical protein
VRIESSSLAVADLQAITEMDRAGPGHRAANRIARHICEAVQSLRTMPNRGWYWRMVVLDVLHGAQRWP